MSADDKQSEASPAVIALIAQGSADSISQREKPKLSKNDKQCLQTILAAITNQLATSDDEQPAGPGLVDPEIENAPVHDPDHKPESLQPKSQQELQQQPTQSEPEPAPEPREDPEPEPERMQVETIQLKDPTCTPFFLTKDSPKEAAVDMDDDAEMLLS